MTCCRWILTIGEYFAAGADHCTGSSVVYPCVQDAATETNQEQHEEEEEEQVSNDAYAQLRVLVERDEL